MIRVGIDLHHLGTRQTGNQTYARELARALAELRAPDLELVGYAGPELVGDSPLPRTERLVPAHPWLRLPLALPRALSRDAIDVAHLPYLLPRRCPCPAVITVHDISYEPHPGFFSAAQVRRWRRLVPAACRRAARVITVSEFCRRELLERYRLPAGKVVVTPEAPGAAFALGKGGDLEALRARLGLERPWLVALGNLSPRKNLIRVVAAFAQAVRRHRLEHDLLLIGPDQGSGRSLREQARRAEVRGRVHTAGWLAETDVVSLLSGATALVYPSLYEGFGLPVVEAMSCGTPVITSATSALPETAGDAALLVDPTDEQALCEAMFRVASDSGLAADLSRRGRAHAASLTWERCARLTAQIYRDAAAPAR